jgi:3-oxoacyl-[acyl-carrier protein] reductase
MKLLGQTAIITGAARGIGAACALKLAQEGVHVVLVDLLSSEETANKIVQAVPDIKARYHAADIRERAQVQRIIDETAAEFGRIDIVVNNAGTCGRIDLEEMTDDIWERDMNTNLKGTFLFTQLAIYPYMKRQGYGRIVNVSSVSGLIGGYSSTTDGSMKGRSGPAYAASKGGVIAFSKWVAKEVGPLGICVNSVAPGPVETEMTKGFNYNLSLQSVKRAGTPEDIAEAVLYFASPASGYTTGQVLKVCGGSAIG